MEHVPLTNPNAIEKTLVAHILNHLGALIIAKSPLKSKAQAEADRYRGQLLASLDDEQRKPFLDSREIIVELAHLLAKSTDRAMLGKTLAYIKSLSQGEVMIVADDTADTAMRKRLATYLENNSYYIPLNDELTDIINIVRNLQPQNQETTP